MTVIQAPSPSVTWDPGALERDEIRVEGREKVSGQARYAADFTMEGMLWAAFLTSPVPHAKIVRIDATKAKEYPGVVAVLTGRDIGERRLGRVLFDWPVLAYEKVRFIGDYVAAVAAQTREAAQEATRLIEVEYEELPAIFDPEQAIAQDEIIIHEHPEGYAYNGKQRPPVPHRNMQGYKVVAHGDVAAGFAQAARIFEHTFTTPRYFAGYIEPRATLVWIDGDDVVHVITTNKSPYGLRQQIAICTGLPPEKIVVEPAFIGGDFGSKGLSVEEFQCYYLARATGRPVKYVRTYPEDIQSTNVRHASKITLRTGVDHDGKFVAFEARLLFDGGAYAAGKPIPDLIPGLPMKTPYNFRNSRIERICAYTNTVPGGHVRAPADIQIFFALESHVDMIARELGVDPLEFRLRNVIRGDEVDVDGTAYHEARAADVLEALREAAGWGAPLPPGRGRGIGLTTRHVGMGKTSLKIGLDPDGTVHVRTGTTEQGGGAFTVIARVVARVLEIEAERVRVTRGATGTVPFDPGVGASRVTHVAGMAAMNGARQLRAKLEEVGYPQVGWEAAVRALLQNGDVEVVGTYEGEHKEGEPEWHDFNAYCVELSVDPQTGSIEIHDVVFVVDVGTIINPVAHRGQINGGFGFGLGHARTEELVVEDGKIVNLNLGEYKLPTQADMPPFRVVHVPTGRGPGPWGAKMAGEVSSSGVAPAIANAVAAACGARITTLPITAERVYEALHR
jgi:CO/xanthine dehydrogenase Mo-binding subunit